LLFRADEGYPEEESIRRRALLPAAHDSEFEKIFAYVLVYSFQLKFKRKTFINKPLFL